jgi:hypothetical protein
MAAALIIFGLSHEPISAISACLLAGASWTMVLTKLYVSTQGALPDWGAVVLSEDTLRANRHEIALTWIPV